jgi:hypothetical protein
MNNSIETLQLVFPLLAVGLLQRFQNWGAPPGGGAQVVSVRGHLFCTKYGLKIKYRFRYSLRLIEI